jgi:hypothetical protein
MNTPAPVDLIPLEVKVSHPSAAILQRGADSALELVEAFEVNDDATYELAAEELNAIKRRSSTLEDQRKAITKPMDDAKKAVMDLFRGPIDLLTKAEGILKGKMLGYQQEQQRKARELQLAAERQAEEERQRLHAEAEKLKAEGRAGEAAVKETVAAMVVATPPAAPATVPKVAGVKTTTKIDYEVVDLHALVKHVAEHPELLNMLMFDSMRVRNYVMGLGMACQLPGVRVFERQSIAGSRK